MGNSCGVFGVGCAFLPLDESRGYEKGHSFGVLGWRRKARRAGLCLAPEDMRRVTPSECFAGNEKPEGLACLWLQGI